MQRPWRGKYQGRGRRRAADERQSEPWTIDAVVLCGVVALVLVLWLLGG